MMDCSWDLLHDLGWRPSYVLAGAIAERRRRDGSALRIPPEQHGNAAPRPRDGVEPTPVDGAEVPWVSQLDRATLVAAIGPLALVRRGLRRVTTDVAAADPGGRLGLGLRRQADDERRHAVELRARVVELAGHEHGSGSDRWIDGAAWQPLRRLVEELLATVDWGEALAALNLVVKPTLDPLVTVQLAGWAHLLADDVTAGLLRGFAPDTAWHRAWTSSLVDASLAHAPENRALLQGWIEAWGPRADQAVDALAPSLHLDGRAARRARARFLSRCQLLDHSAAS